MMAAVHHFHYISHHHYHFHYHNKIHLCCLKILLTVHLFNMIFYWHIFSLVLFQALRFLHPIKGLRFRLRPSYIFSGLVVSKMPHMRQSQSHGVSEECSKSEQLSGALPVLSAPIAVFKNKLPKGLGM